MRAVVNHIARYDWLLLGAVLMLMGLGLVSLFSLSGVGFYPFFGRQILWIILGLLAMCAMSLVDFRFFKTQSAAVLIFYLVALALLLFPLLGRVNVRGIAGWIKIGGIFIQPVELVKLALIIVLAKFFSKRHVEIYRIQHLAVSGLYFALPAFLVLLEPDLGAAIVLASIWVAVIIFSGIKLRHFFLLFLIAAIILGSGWQFILKPYQKSRIVSFLNPYADPRGASYQMLQSIIAVGSGEIWGKGMGYGSQSHLNFLPEAETDFIFAAYAEEWGLIGVAVMLGLFLLVLWRTIFIGLSAGDNFSRLYTLGFAALIFVQLFIHAGMNMGVLPIAGLTLPFVSYGGSSLITLLAGTGILQNIKINSRPVRDAEG